MMQNLCADMPCFCRPGHIFAITETWLSGSVYNGKILLNNFIIYRCDRSSRGGGVLIAVKDTIPNLLLPTPTSNLKVLTVQIGIERPPLILCLAYIPPNAAAHTCEPLLTHLYDLGSRYNSLLILGNFNISDVNWDTLTATSSISDSFCDLAFNLNLFQLIKNPTHTQGNILDIMLTNVEESLHALAIHPRDAFPLHSDHYPITFKLLCASYTSPRKCEYIYDYSKANYEGMNALLFNSNISPCLNINDVETVWSMIKTSVSKATVCLPIFLNSNHEHDNIQNVLSNTSSPA